MLRSSEGNRPLTWGFAVVDGCRGERLGVHGGLKIYRGSPAAARAYVEADRSRTDDYYLAEGTGLAARLIASPDGVFEDAPLEGPARERWVAGRVVETDRPKGRLRSDDQAVRFVEVTVNGPKTGRRGEDQPAPSGPCRAALPEHRAGRAPGQRVRLPVRIQQASSLPGAGLRGLPPRRVVLGLHRCPVRRDGCAQGRPARSAKA
jgi:hypothetical protein